jgi:catechol 2,3-dioxygenase-like lactoylglutathione lyase family enzyme
MITVPIDPLPFAVAATIGHGRRLGETEDGLAKRGFRLRALGEIAIRTANMAAMVAFYQDVLGLRLLSRRDQGRIALFRLGDGFAGHTAVLALFDAAGEEVAGGAVRSSLHHLALSLPREEQDAAQAWLDQQAIPYRVEEFAWIGWRGVFLDDPDGNTIELVAYDASLLDD